MNGRDAQTDGPFVLGVVRCRVDEPPTVQS